MILCNQDGRINLGLQLTTLNSSVSLILLSLRVHLVPCHSAVQSKEKLVQALN